MISILVVEDDAIKYGRVHKLLTEMHVREDDITHVVAAADAVTALNDRPFDIMILDINIPRRHGEGVRRGGGIELLTEIDRGASAHRPQYIVGLTAFEDVIAEFGDKFDDLLWSLVRYVENSDQWIAQIKSKIEYVSASKGSHNFTDGITYGFDVAIVCALEGVEFAAVKALDCSWQPLRLRNDETRYISGTIQCGQRLYSVVAGAAPRMGMPASAVLAGKMISQFRPRLLAMVGICAGRHEKTALGDVIVGDPCWDWGSGKIDSVKNKPRFRPAPHHVELETDVCAELKEICSDVGLLARIKAEARGKRPRDELRVHFGPIASGAAVVANGEVFEGLLDQHRNLLGLEMEAYGIVAACKGSGKPRPVAVVMKSVCDFADKDKDDDFQEYAASTSALLLYHCAPRLIELSRK